MGMLGNSYSTEQSTNSSDLARAELAVRTLGAPPSPTDASSDGSREEDLTDAGGLVGSGCFLTAFALGGSVFTAHAGLPVSAAAA